MNELRGLAPRDGEKCPYSTRRHLAARTQGAKWKCLPPGTMPATTLNRYDFQISSEGQACHSGQAVHGVCVWRRLAALAAAILAAVEDGILPSGMSPLDAELKAKPARQSAGQDARLYGRRNARRNAEQILHGRSSTSFLCDQTRLDVVQDWFPFRLLLIAR